MEKIPKIFNLDKSEIEKILKISETKIFHKDEVVYREGETAQDIYILLEGGLKITFMGQEIGRIYPVHFIGEMSVFTDNLRSATITSLTEVTLLQMTKDNLLMLFERDKDLQIQFQHYIIRLSS